MPIVYIVMYKDGKKEIEDYPVPIPEDVPEEEWLNVVIEDLRATGIYEKGGKIRFVTPELGETSNPKKAWKLSLPESCEGLSYEDFKKYEIFKLIGDIPEEDIERELRRKRAPREVFECVEDLHKLIWTL